MQSKRGLIWPMLASLSLAAFAYPATHLPPKFGVFPPVFMHMGYLPPGILVWLMFIWAGLVFGFDSRIE